jgi:putative transposase
MVVRKRLSPTGPTLFFVTTTVVDWLPVFADDDCVRDVLAQLGETLNNFHSSVCAYVVMPSHIHALIGLPEAPLLSSFMREFKRGSARRIRDRIPTEELAVLVKGNTYDLLRPRFDELVIWSETQSLVKAEYIHNNPGKAGLVANAIDYSFSSARQWSGQQGGELLIDRGWHWT